MQIPHTSRALLGSCTGVSGIGDRVVLTYDDGPEPESTTAVLTALREHSATATFFVLVGRARRQRALLAEVLSEGHEVAVHGLDHRRLTNLPRREVLRRSRDAKAELEDLTGTPMRWFRPPYGKQRVSDYLAIRALGLEVILWGPTLQDWRDTTHDERLNSAMDGVGPGAILLGHDGYAEESDGANDGPRPTLDRRRLTADVLELYAERGLAGVSVGGAVGLGGRFESTVTFHRRSSGGTGYGAAAPS